MQGHYGGPQEDRQQYDGRQDSSSQGSLQPGQYGSSQGSLQPGQYGSSQGSLQPGQYGSSQGSLQPGQYGYSQGSLQDRYGKPGTDPLARAGIYAQNELSPGADVIDSTYIIQEKIGSGSGGIVYRAWHKRLQKPVVLKKMKVSRSSISENRRETDILKRLRHSYLPGVIDFIDVNGEVFTVMDYIEGQSLSEVLKSGVHFTQEQAVTYGSQLLEALVYLHGQNPPVLHGDIKPSNIMLTPEGNICLIDFNISGYLTDNRFFVKGYTQGYAAPEQVRVIQNAIRTGTKVPPGAFDERADLYSVGAVLFTLLTGYRPHPEWERMQEALEQMQVSDGLIAVLYRALQPDPNQRCSSAAQMLEELKNYRKMERSYRQKVMRRRILLFCSLAALLVCIVAAAGFLRMRRAAKERDYQGNLTQLQTIAEETETADTDSGQSYEERYQQAMDLYDNCTALYPDRLDPLVQMARFLYLSREYDVCIRLIQSDLVAEDAEASDPKAYGEVCYLLGNAFYEKGNPAEAVQAYEKAVENTDSNPDFFRDYAIALAQSDDIDGAKKILDEAEENGLRESQIALVQGEICSREGNYDEAISNFDFCIDKAEDDADRLRACLLEEKAYEGKGITEANMRKAAQMLEDARLRLPDAKKPPVLERLAQTYIYLYDLTEDASWAGESISAFEQIIKSGWGTLMTYNNIIVMSQKIGDLSGAGEYARRMEELWPEDYRTYKRLAFLEEASQEKRAQEDRDYSLFAKYYTKARDLFAEQADAEEEDAEMGILKDIYSQLLQKGWIN